MSANYNHNSITNYNFTPSRFIIKGFVFKTFFENEFIEKKSIRIQLRGLKALKIDSSREQKFKHTFQDSINPLCDFGYKVEFTVHSFLHCPLFTNEKSTLFSTSYNLDSKLFGNTDSLLTNILLFNKESLNKNQNTGILNATMECILSTF